MTDSSVNQTGIFLPRHTEMDASAPMKEEHSSLTDANLLEQPSYTDAEHVYGTKPHVSQKPPPVPG